MKKTLYTVAFIALLSLASNAQDHKKEAKQTTPAKKEAVNPDGTVKPASSQPELVPASSEAKTDDSKAQKKEGTRMAITEKGVPASKKPAEKKAEATEKH